MTFKDLVIANRSYRRFDGTHTIPATVLRDLVGLARTTPSGGNLQPLKYVLSCSAEGNALVYETLAWATYLPEWKGPPVHERPTAYVVVLRDLTITQTARVQVSDIDLGIAAQTILLGAIERGLGGCMFASMKREELARRLGLPDTLAVALVIALGKPVEKVVLDDLAPGGSIKYWREPDGTHHVPKRGLEELILKQI
ncbi:MAG: nitroreductase family protein [Spirochaetes bacterium]|nr:nitroreductase family protein [Spirochaetota bacterium]